LIDPAIPRAWCAVLLAVMTRTSLPGRLAALVVAALAWCALLLQLGIVLRGAIVHGSGIGQAILTYFGYFTVLSNLFIALIGTAGAMGRTPDAPGLFYGPQSVGCGTTAIVLVGLTYHALLRQLWDPTGAQRLADVLLHYVVPLTAVLHWLVYRGRDQLSWRAPFRWCLYPVLYFVFMLLRGALTDIYPYPFVDVTALGYVRVLGNAAALLGAFTVLGFAVRGVGRLLSSSSTH
jgi:hypothetical protein